MSIAMLLSILALFAIACFDASPSALLRNTRNAAVPWGYHGRRSAIYRVARPIAARAARNDVDEHRPHRNSGNIEYIRTLISSTESLKDGFPYKELFRQHFKDELGTESYRELEQMMRSRKVYLNEETLEKDYPELEMFLLLASYSTDLSLIKSDATLIIPNLCHFLHASRRHGYFISESHKSCIANGLLPDELFFEIAAFHLHDAVKLIETLRFWIFYQQSSSPDFIPLRLTIDEALTEYANTNDDFSNLAAMVWYSLQPSKSSYNLEKSLDAKLAHSDAQISDLILNSLAVMLIRIVESGQVQKATNLYKRLKYFGISIDIGNSGELVWSYAGLKKNSERHDRVLTARASGIVMGKWMPHDLKLTNLFDLQWPV